MLDLTLPLAIESPIGSGQYRSVELRKKLPEGQCTAIVHTPGNGQTCITFEIPMGNVVSAAWRGHIVVNPPPLERQIVDWRKKAERDLRDHKDREVMEASSLWGAF